MQDLLTWQRCTPHSPTHLYSVVEHFHFSQLHIYIYKIRLCVTLLKFDLLKTVSADHVSTMQCFLVADDWSP